MSIGLFLLGICIFAVIIGIVITVLIIVAWIGEISEWILEND